MGVQPPPPDDITARRGQAQVAAAGGHWTGQQNGGADLQTKLQIQVGGSDVARLDTPGAATLVGHTHAQALHQRAHGAHIADVGDVVERDRFLGEQAGGEQGQCGILVARRGDLALQRMPPLDDELLHLLPPCDRLREPRSAYCKPNQ